MYQSLKPNTLTCLTWLTEGVHTLVAKSQLGILENIFGKIVAMFPASDHAQLHYRALDQFKVRMLILHKSKWTRKVTLSPSALKQLRWWRDNVQMDKMERSLYLHPPEVHLYVDSCDEAWGSVLEGKEIKSVFSHEQQLLHINTKELLAVYYGILSHIAVLTGRSFVVYSDNVTTVSTLKKKSSANKMRDHIVGRIFQLVLDHNMFLHTSWISGDSNGLADMASHTAIKSCASEWSCHPDTIKFLKNLLEFEANIDFFSTHLNNILPVLASLCPCPGSIMTDCFNLDWDKYIGFIHCPPKLIPRCLHQIEANRVRKVQGIFPSIRRQIGGCPWCLI